ncbi:MAG: hypothetical protein NTV34_13215, partial [Proteobacteria bacterium]|nr:hypothetical protein [Pseudomonadota bacterium]
MKRGVKISSLQHVTCSGFVGLSSLFMSLNAVTPSEATAQDQGVVEQGVAEDDSEEYLDESNSEWAESRGGDLETSQGERRAAATYAFLMAFGEGSAWNSIGLRGVYWLSQDVAVSSTVGNGRFHQVGESGVQSQTTNVQSLGMRGQWWPSHHFPLALA